MNHIVRNIYLGDWNDSVNENQLTQNRIKKIICLNENIKPPSAMRLYERLGIEHVWINIADDPLDNISQYFAYCINSMLIDGNVLVHCTAGISRSATIVIKYIMYECNMSKEDAIAYVRSKRPVINPNWGFLMQLKFDVQVIQYL